MLSGYQADRQTSAAWCLYSWAHWICSCLFYLASFTQHYIVKFIPVLCLDVVHWLRCFHGSPFALVFRDWWAHDEFKLGTLEDSAAVGLGGCSCAGRAHKSGRCTPRRGFARPPGGHLFILVDTAYLDTREGARGLRCSGRGPFSRVEDSH